jgi:hypothetical protein
MMIEAQKGLAEVTFSKGVRFAKCRPMPYLTIAIEYVSLHLASFSQ